VTEDTYFVKGQYCRRCCSQLCWWLGQFLRLYTWCLYRAVCWWHFITIAYSLWATKCLAYVWMSAWCFGPDYQR